MRTAQLSIKESADVVEYIEKTPDFDQHTPASAAVALEKLLGREINVSQVRRIAKELGVKLKNTKQKPDDGSAKAINRILAGTLIEMFELNKIPAPRHLRAIINAESLESINTKYKEWKSSND